MKRLLNRTSLFVAAVISGWCLPAGWGQSPDTIPSLQLWYRADQGVTAGTNDLVSQWTSQAEGGHTATQGTEANQPLFESTGGGGGSSTLRFTSDDYLQASGAQNTVSTAMTLFVVFSLDATGVNMGLVDTKSSISNNRGFYLAVRSSNQLEFRVQDIGASGTSMNHSLPLPASPIGDHFVAMARIDDEGNGTLRLLNNVVTTERELALTNISGSSIFTMGANTQGNWGLNGSISSVVLFNEALNDTQANQVYDYLYNTHVVPELTSGALLSLGLLSLTIKRNHRKY